MGMRRGGGEYGDERGGGEYGDEKRRRGVWG